VEIMNRNGPLNSKFINLYFFLGGSQYRLKHLKKSRCCKFFPVTSDFGSCLNQNCDKGKGKVVPVLN
jgi:hypothetical protein